MRKLGRKAGISRIRYTISIRSNGGHEGTRTPNFLLVREAVYQLTYMPEPAKTVKNKPKSMNLGELIAYEFRPF